MNSNPLMPGICKSVMTTSKLSRSRTLRASTGAGQTFDLVPGVAEHVGDRLPGLRMVVDDQHATGQRSAQQPAWGIPVVR